jgi:ribonuclease HI
MSNLNWKKDADRQRMQRQGIEDKAGLSKDALRREADRLLAEYTGPMKMVPAGIRVTGSQVSGEFPSERAPGNVARSVTGNASSKPSADRPQMRGKQKARKKQGDLFRTASRSVPSRNAFERAVPPGLVIYCDGACEPNPGAGGWGFVVYRDGVEMHVGQGGSSQTTNNVMELTGALMALRWIAEFAAGRSARLFCDSQYVVKGCNEWRHGWKRKGWRRGVEKELANADLWRELDQALTITPIVLEWCKGHVGIIGNERSDELSLEGRSIVLEIEGPTVDDLIREQLDYSARGFL